MLVCDGRARLSHLQPMRRAGFVCRGMTDPHAGVVVGPQADGIAPGGGLQRRLHLRRPLPQPDLWGGRDSRSFESVMGRMATDFLSLIEKQNTLAKRWVVKYSAAATG